MVGKIFGNIWEIFGKTLGKIFGEYLGPDHLFGDISAPFPNPQSYILIKMGGGGQYNGFADFKMDSEMSPNKWPGPK